MPLLWAPIPLWDMLESEIVSRSVVSNSLQPHGSKPWCPTLCSPMVANPNSLQPLCSPPGSSVHGILQVRILEWVAIPFFRGLSWPRDWILVSCIAGRFFTIWATREAPEICLPHHILIFWWLVPFPYWVVSSSRAETGPCHYSIPRIQNSG